MYVIRISNGLAAHFPWDTNKYSSFLYKYNDIAMKVERFLMFPLSHFAILHIVKRLGAPLTQAFGF
jgi:hypothetical protein